MLFAPGWLVFTGWDAASLRLAARHDPKFDDVCRWVKGGEADWPSKAPGLACDLRLYVLGGTRQDISGSSLRLPEQVVDVFVAAAGRVKPAYLVVEVGTPTIREGNDNCRAWFTMAGKPVVDALWSRAEFQYTGWRRYRPCGTVSYGDATKQWPAPRGTMAAWGNCVPCVRSSWSLRGSR